MSSTQKLKLGTRRSLLAWAQSGWVARELERLNPGLQVELVGIETRGDKIQDVPLQSVQGKEFFVTELDENLRSGGVDLTVHSLKDLSLERPAEFVRAAIPKRENPRDVVLFNSRVLDQLAAGQPLRIGTSSPRRLENIPSFLERVLPRIGDVAPRVEFAEIRGNVNTRLGRIHEAADSPRYLDAVVLAFAGLIRLWADHQARPEMQRLLEGARWMVLPLRECPTAPGQGALAIECRAADARVRELIGRLNDRPTANQVDTERQVLADWGGGCHQKFGATALQSAELGTLMHIRGRKPDQEFVEETRWDAPALPRGEVRAWDGAIERAADRRTVRLPVADSALGGAEAIFVAHSRAVPESWRKALPKLASARLWTSGTASWARLAELGLWIEGCAEGLGFVELRDTQLGEPVLRLPGSESWVTLTHDRAPGVASYRVEGGAAPSGDGVIAGATHIFWSSGSQFDELGSKVDPGAHQSCGAGKTAAHLRERGVRPAVFPSVEEWRKWLKGK